MKHLKMKIVTENIVTNMKWVYSVKKIKAQHILTVAAGAFFSAVAIKFFVRSANLIPSGVSGVAILLIKEIQAFFGMELSYGLVFLVLNALVLLFVYNKLGKRFIILSFLHVVLTSIFVDVLPAPYLTDDTILLAIFGGFSNAIGGLLALSVGASTGGTDFIAIYFSSIRNKPMWDKILFFNVALLIYSGARYNWQLAFYSIIYQMISLKTIDAYHNRYKLSSMRIITKNPDALADEILKVTRHGITRQSGIGVFGKEERDILYIVVNKFEVDGIIQAVLKGDPHAFIEVSNVERVVGNYRQKPLD